MKIIYSFLLLMFLNLNLNCQNLEMVDKVLLSYKEPKSIEGLSERIDYDFKTKIEKVRAVYNWIALNIEYNTFDTFFLKNPEFVIYQNEYDRKRYKEKRKEFLINKVFKNKKGVCYDYALLFQKLCNLLNIKNELIYGYTKSSINSIGLIPTAKNHVWNAVEIDGKWLLFDVTYGSGHIYKGVWQKEMNLSYFNVKKEKLKLTHFPVKKYWQNYIKQKPLKDFCLAPFYQDAYLKNKIEIIKPQIGEIKISKKNKKIKLKVNNFKKHHTIHYAYSSDNIIRIPTIENNDSYTSISFKNPQKSTGLHIYIDNELTLEYKITLN